MQPTKGFVQVAIASAGLWVEFVGATAGGFEDHFLIGAAEPDEEGAP